eukprot:6158701-Prorocentrum_lima.AAC.1
MGRPARVAYPTSHAGRLSATWPHGESWISERKRDAKDGNTPSINAPSKYISRVCRRQDKIDRDEASWMS